MHGCRNPGQVTPQQMHMEAWPLIPLLFPRLSLAPIVHHRPLLHHHHLPPPYRTNHLAPFPRFLNPSRHHFPRITKPNSSHIVCMIIVSRIRTSPPLYHRFRWHRTIFLLVVPVLLKRFRQDHHHPNRVGRFCTCSLGPKEMAALNTMPMC